MARSAHGFGWVLTVLGGMPSLLNEMEDLRQVVCKLTAKLMWLSGVDFPEERGVTEFGVPLPVGSQRVHVERIEDRIAEQMVHVPVPQMKQDIVESTQLVPSGAHGRLRSTS